ncbi:MAG: DUF3365 domain-containing protein [Bacteroidales bacterium]|nr:DUF3365 domain-containing protein [Bacteroidales bacterium]
MKNLILIFSASILLIITGCRSSDFEISTPTNEENEELVKIGNAVSNDLLVSLKGELKKAIEEGGFKNAIAVCNLKAIPITEIVANKTDKKVTVKRTTFQYRNPANAPNEAEKQALDFYIGRFEANKAIPDIYTQKVSEKGQEYYYFYKPLVMDNLCLMCHGTSQTMQSEMMAFIDELYPEDMAVGYKEGDFRALVSIRIDDL